MDYFLARLGRHKLAPFIVPGLSAAAFLTHWCSEQLFLDQYHDYFVAQTPDGQNVTLSEQLSKLIDSVTVEVKKTFLPLTKLEQGIINRLNYNIPETQQRWFASSTLEPINFGSTQVRTGSLIGLPSYYNYVKAEDVPDYLFELRKLNIFGSSKVDEKEEEEKKLLGLPHQKIEKGKLIKKIERDSEEGKEFLESLLLSDEAKSFSIARELFLADTHRTEIRSVIFGASLLMAYASGGFTGYGTYKIFANGMDEYFDEQSVEKAKNLGELYSRGAEEYARKRVARDKVFRSLAQN